MRDAVFEKTVSCVKSKPFVSAVFPFSPFSRFSRFRAACPRITGGQDTRFVCISWIIARNETLSKCVLLHFPTWVRTLIPARGAETIRDYRSLHILLCSRSFQNEKGLARINRFTSRRAYGEWPPLLLRPVSLVLGFGSFSPAFSFLFLGLPFG